MIFNYLHFDHTKHFKAFSINDYDDFLKCYHYSNFHDEEYERFWIENKML